MHQEYFHFLIQVSLTPKTCPIPPAIINLTFSASKRQINLTEHQVFNFFKGMNQSVNQLEDWIDCFHLRLDWSSQSLQ